MNVFSLAFMTTALSLGVATAVTGQSTATITGPAETSARPAGPQADFASLTFNFGQIESGQVIHHDYIFTNTGSQTLTIRDVRPSCGCTTTGLWDKQVEPGKAGKIPVEFNSTGVGGSISKTIEVVCNDPAQTNIILHIAGTVWQPIEITPPYATFNLGPDFPTNETRILKIINNLTEAVTITDPIPSHPLFNTEVRTVRDGKEYELRVTFSPPSNPTNISSPITLRTSSAKVPVITATAFALVHPLVTLTPPQITLPPGPLAADAPFAIVIRNNGVNPLRISDPTLLVLGAKVQLQENQPGRVFALRGSFPAGFTAPKGQPIGISLKTDHPRQPLVTVQVVQSLATNSSPGSSVGKLTPTQAPFLRPTPPPTSQPLPSTQR